MKLRRTPDDFAVEEQTSLPIGTRGDHAVFLLRKRGWTTLDALERIARAWNVPRHAVAHAGLKDRHAVTTQFITIRGASGRSWDSGDISLEYLGQSPRAVTADDIVENRFQLVLRSLSEQEQGAIQTALPEVAAEGLPNFFDDQRFGSYRPEAGFVAEPWLRGNYEEAIYRAFAAADPSDSRSDREQKEILRRNWGQWKACKQQLERSHARSIVTFLDDRPGDFKGAWGRVRSELRGLYLSALQSDLWNQIVSTAFADYSISGELSAERAELVLKPGPVCYLKQFDTRARAELARMEIPLPSARITIVPGPLHDRVERGLAVRGWKLEDLKVRYPRDRFFSRGGRRIQIPASGLTWNWGDDELHPSRRKLDLSFSLPRGSYATILVKRILAGADAPELSGPELLDD